MIVAILDMMEAIATMMGIAVGGLMQEGVEVMPGVTRRVDTAVEWWTKYKSEKGGQKAAFFVEPLVNIDKKVAYIKK